MRATKYQLLLLNILVLSYWVAKSQAQQSHRKVRRRYLQEEKNDVYGDSNDKSNNYSIGEPASESNYNKDGNNDSEFEIVLDPFQLELRFDNDQSLARSAMTSRDEMIILETAQTFLSERLHDTISTFSRLALFQYVRDFPIEEKQHVAKAAFGGFAFFSMPNMDPASVQLEIYLSFLGEMKMTFVQALLDAGLEDIVNVTLMSIDGTEMEYRDGTLQPVGQTSSFSSTPSSTISDDDSHDDPASTDSHVKLRGENSIWIKTIVISLLIPAVIFCIVLTIYGYRVAREINWDAANNNTAIHPDSCWQSSEYNYPHHVVVSKRRSQKENNDDDGQTERSESGRRRREEEEKVQKEENDDKVELQ